MLELRGLLEYQPFNTLGLTLRGKSNIFFVQLAELQPEFSLILCLLKEESLCPIRDLNKFGR